MSIQARKPEAWKGNQAEGRVCALRHHRETERIVVQTTSGICSRVRNHLLFLVNRVNLNLKTLEIGCGEFEEEESRHLRGNLGLLRLLPSARIWARCENRPKRGQDVAGLDGVPGQGAEPLEHQFQMTFGACYKTLFTIFTINPFSQGFSHRVKPVTKATARFCWHDWLHLATKVSPFTSRTYLRLSSGKYLRFFKRKIKEYSWNLFFKKNGMWDERNY